MSVNFSPLLIVVGRDPVEIWFSVNGLDPIKALHVVTVGTYTIKRVVSKARRTDDTRTTIGNYVPTKMKSSGLMVFAI